MKISSENWQGDDIVSQRKEPFTLLRDIEDRIGNVAKAELELGRTKILKIFDAFGDDEIGEDEINEFICRVKKFYEDMKSKLSTGCLQPVLFCAKI